MATSRCAVLAGILVFASSVHSEEAATEQHKLQGTWAVTAIVSSGESKQKEGAQVVFDGDLLTLGEKGQEPRLKMRFTLAPTTSPRQIDFIPQGNGAAADAKLPGIYQHEGDVLLLCVAQGDPRKLRRPESFESKKGTTDLLLTLKRLKE